MTAAPVLAFDDVHFAYPGSPAGVLHGVTLAVQPREGVAVLGANGAGKSTLLRLAMALAHPVRGRVTCAGLETAGRGPEDLAARTGFVFQTPEDQLFAVTVAEELAFGPRLAGWRAEEIAGRTLEVLHALQLDDTALRHPGDLPAPARRLITVGCALMLRPTLLLLDEPSAGLDAAARAVLVRVLRTAREAGTAVLAVTHDAAFALEALDRGIVLREGRVAADGPLGELLCSGDPHLPRLPLPLATVLQLGIQTDGWRFGDAARALAARLRDG